MADNGGADDGLVAGGDVTTGCDGAANDVAGPAVGAVGDVVDGVADWGAIATPYGEETALVLLAGTVPLELATRTPTTAAIAIVPEAIADTNSLRLRTSERARRLTSLR